MLEWIRIAAGNVSKWLFGREAEHRADFAAITDSYENLANVVKEDRDKAKEDRDKAQERVEKLEERMDNNRERYTKILDELTDLKLKMSELIVSENECQKHLVTTKEMLLHAAEELAAIKKRIIE